MADIVTVNKNNFQKEVLESNIPVLVDFWAPWCGPCRVQAPILDELAKEINNKAKIAKLNTDENGELASQYGIMSIPTLILFKDGEEKERVVGVTRKDALKELFEKYSD